MKSRYSALGRNTVTLQEIGGGRDGSGERGEKGNGEKGSGRRKERFEGREKERGRGRRGEREREIGLGFE